MKKLISTVALLGAVVAGAAPAQAGDTRIMLPIAGALAANDAQTRLGDSVKFFFGDQPAPKVLKKLGADQTSLKTIAIARPNENACNWVFLSNLLKLQERARELGANAVVNIVSNYDDVENPSASEYECHVGPLMAGVAFKGEFVTIADKPPGQ
jgi:imidazole glycerol phosphate synthase subunit HisF